MNAPEKIYIETQDGKPSSDAWYDFSPSWTDAVKYIRHDLHAAVVAENEELRGEVERLKSELEIVDRAGHNESESNISLRTTLIGIKNRIEQALK